MRRSRKPIVIASRSSALARVQAERVGAALGRLHPSLRIEYLWIESQGDKMVDKPLHDVGGKGLFTRAVDNAVLEGNADLSVHSLKDLSATETQGLTIAAVPKRNDVRDTLVSAEGYASIDALPERVAVGTASPRRKAQLLRKRPDIEISILRGNVPTRLERVMEGRDGFGATIMAVAGLKRLGLTEHLRFPIDTDTMLPAACQGALALVCRSDDHVTLTRCLPLNHAVSAAEVHAERELLRHLHADCHHPIAVLAEQTVPDHFRFRAEVLSPDGAVSLSIDERATTKSLRRVVQKSAARLLERGADRLLGRDSFPLPNEASPAG
ncbi:hydroxymethylbilane synthase [Mucisphaera calidilacus]|uniref:Hydroxymethylbilane synthase n=1 Tax=Mucisphaera calidilacus TaxID=2527982 RepID=A0A518BTR6_9BACT|nr:hydroxymethylbilane synthase [Mucisphaera calidilacus]QDU70355.1 Porphobilinogen deaminase [Mucisphaera calidilacus]